MKKIYVSILNNKDLLVVAYSAHGCNGHSPEEAQKEKEKKRQGRWPATCHWQRSNVELNWDRIDVPL